MTRLYYRRIVHQIDERSFLKEVIYILLFVWLIVTLVQLSLPKELPGSPHGNEYSNYRINYFQLKPLVNVVALQPQLGMVVNDVNSFRFTINDGYKRCKVISKRRNNEERVFVVIGSSPHNYENRQAIRQTWAKQLGDSNYLYSFFIGLTRSAVIQQMIDQESQVYGDIIQVGLYERYPTMSQKTVALLHWTLKYCSAIDLILKTTDNVYLNVNNFNHLIDSLNENILKQDDDGKRAGLYGNALGCKKCTGGIIKPKRDESKLLFLILSF